MASAPGHLLDLVGNTSQPTCTSTGLNIPVPLDDFDWGHDSDHEHLSARALDVFIHAMLAHS